MKPTKLSIVALVALGGCTSLDQFGQPPSLTPAVTTDEFAAMSNPEVALPLQAAGPLESSSLWSGTKQSLLGDRRALERGDILTVVVEIDDRAEISNESERSRSANETLGVPDLLGFPQRLDRQLPAGASSSALVGINANSTTSGDGSVTRRERLTLRVAAAVTEVLPNGVLAISGTQEVRVNFELRELIVSGYVRPADISRQNEITYDKIASARVSYGGRGHITDVQQPRYGQQVLDAVLPF
ncbi:MAG: flagellar basal body L-ring protein FlgH [Pseudomonadota bacterium]